MKRLYKLFMLMVLLPFFASQVHAEDFVLRFTASTQYADYHEFSTVKVENLTRNWQHELIYPDTVLVLHSAYGIEEHEDYGDALSIAGPNPFKGTAYAELQLSDEGSVELLAMQIDGKLVARYEGTLPRGTHRITFHASAPQMYLLVANTSKGCFATKLMNTGYGMGSNGLEVDMVSKNIEKNYTKSRYVGTFMPGDNMRYTAYDEEEVSNAIIQHQYQSEDITLQFIVQGTILPKVRTDNFTNIGATSVTANGEVYSDGGDPVSERGICWSTQPDPTINDNRIPCGSGLGVFSADITDLTPNTTYYVRAYAINGVGTAYGLQKSVVTFATLPTVITYDVTEIGANDATANGEIVSDGGDEVTERGFCWATHDNPTLNDNVVVCGSGLGEFNAVMTNLVYNTVYYVRAYAVNSVDVRYGNLKSFETSLPLPEVITLDVTGIGTTTATGNGEVVSDGGVAVTERGVCWSTSHNPTVSDSHVASGSGLGIFDAAMTGLTPHTIYYVRAYATNSVGTSYGEEKQFVTMFDAPDGTTGGLFSVAADKQVYFSNGNLQYQASTGVWRFADHQWDYLGNNNANVSPTYSGWIDLMGWGTGNNPTNSSDNDADYASFIDWGVNPISNGGNAANMWRTLKNAEWEYLLNIRATTTGIRYAKATVNGVPGVIIIPDEWNTDYYTLNSTNVSGAAFTVNTITDVEWESVFNVHGAMFLPAAGDRSGTLVEGAGEYGLYWSSSSGGNDYAYNMGFDEVAVITGYFNRHWGRSVRLVVPVMEVLTLDASDVDASAATLNGKLYCKDISTVTSLGFVYGTDANNLDNNVAATTIDHSFSVSISNLKPGTVYYYKAHAITEMGEYYGNLVAFTTDAVLAEVITNDVTEIGTTTATGNGEVVSDGGATVTERGVCWSTTQNPTISDSHVASGSGLGTFSAAMTGLSLNTTYYVRAFAINSVGVAYGDEVSFTTEAELAVVITNNVTEIGTTTATGNGEVVSDGGATVTERGICWSTTQNPTISDSHVASGSGLGTFSAAMTGLSLNTTYYVRAYAVNSVGVAYGDEVSFTTEAELAVVVTNDVTEIGTTTATGNGEVVSDGGATVTERGICWSTTQNPTISDSHVASGSGLGSFSAAMTGLSLNTTYYVRAYAINSVGVAYGDEMSFTTEAELAVVITNNVTEIGTTTATGNGEVVSDGGATVTERGVCWSTTQNPTISDSHVASGSGLGTFSAAMTGLSLNTTYYVRAYAINSVGVTYGDEMSFTTEAELAVVITNNVTEIGTTTATGNGEVVSDGGATVTERGVCWSTTHNPTVSDSHVASGSGLGTFSAAMTGLSLNTTYYVRAYAINSVGVAYGDEVSFTTEAELPVVITNNVTEIGTTTATGNGEVVSDGGATVTERGICWSTTQNPTISDSHVASGSGLGTFSAAMTGLSLNTTYYVRAFAINSVGVAYGDEVSFTTEAELAVVITNNVTEIGTTTATGNGEVVSDGGATVTERGICWSTTQNPTISDSHVASGSGLGTFSAAMTGLSLNTTYYVRAYAVNSVGVAYGDEVSFTTEAELAVVVTNDVTEIGTTTATGNGEVVSDGGATVTERGICWSTTQNPTISDSHVASGSGLGTFSAAMTGLQPHTSYYVRAYATNSVGTSYGEEKQFTTESAGPEGSTGGLFSVTADKQVYFSQGNLQYQASTDTWRFAESQLDYVGDNTLGTVYENGVKCNNALISPTYTGWIDLFGWGTGNNPTNTSTSNSSYFIFTDWGVNPISNGGNVADMWRTPTKDEWNYLLLTRTTTSGIRFAKATVNGISGMIILPDDWSTSYYSLNSANTPDAAFAVNTITFADWTSALEAHGAVFLPAAGYRNGTTLVNVGTGADYKSSTSQSQNLQGTNVYGFYFGNSYFGVGVLESYRGHSVRLVCPTMEVLTSKATNVEAVTATLNGKFYCMDANDITSYGFVYGTSATNLTSTVSATANGHSFSTIVNGLSGNTTYYYKAFVTTADGTYYGEVKQFVTLVAPVGSTGCRFSVAADKKVYFSNGNLQYQASTGTWRFAEIQHEFCASSNGNISSTYDGWIDLFGWGTGSSPTKTTTTNSAYPSFVDWGANPISNGGNTADMWRTLSNDEWNYLLYTRTTNSGIRFANVRRTINGFVFIGLIILPDSWDPACYTFAHANENIVNYISEEVWTNILEPNGAVYLPCGCYREGTTVTPQFVPIDSGVNTGYYWSSTPSENNSVAYSLKIESYTVSLLTRGRHFGHSVRLVADE